MNALRVPGLSLVCCLLFSLATSCLVFAQRAPGDQANGSILVSHADQNPVPVPLPGAIALRWYQSGNVLWIVTQVWALAVPTLLLFTGLSARMRNWANRLGRRWPLVIGVYLIFFLVLTLAVNLPLSYYAGYVRPHAYGLSNQSLGRWFGNMLKSLVVPNTQFPPFQVPGLMFGYLFVLLLYSLLRKSPKRWWLYAGLALIPVIFFGALIKPVWLDPLSHEYGPLKDQALERSILELAQRAGVEGGRVYQVNMSRDTKTMDANVTGFGGTERIVVWDTTVTGLEKKELLTVLAHEMGHYVLGHPGTRILFQSFLLLTALGLVHCAAGPLVKRYKSQFGFDRLDDIASLPLVLLFLNVAILMLLPADFAFMRHQEHEADLFALELTRDNHSAGTAFVKLTQGVLGVPRHGWLFTAWRGTHPSLGDRLDFFNEYRPWQTGQPLKYDHFIKTTK
jgi:Zn-dependent protease with chaperone function